MNRPVMACHAALRQYPSDMLHAVLDKTMGHLMEKRHLLMKPKYKELWGKSYTKELGCLAQGIPGVSKGTDTIVFIHRKDIYTIANAMSCKHKSVEIIARRRRTPTAHKSPWAAISSTTLATVAHLPLT